MDDHPHPADHEDMNAIEELEYERGPITI